MFVDIQTNAVANSYRVDNVTATKNGDKLDIKIEVQNFYRADELSDDVMLVCSYDENDAVIGTHMQAVSLAVLEANTFEASVTKSAKVKVFVFDDLDNLVPLAYGAEN